MDFWIESTDVWCVLVSVTRLVCRELLLQFSLNQIVKANQITQMMLVYHVTTDLLQDQHVHFQIRVLRTDLRALHYVCL